MRLVFNVLRWHTRLCAWINCSLWITKPCMVDNTRKLELAAHLREVVAQLQQNSAPLRWGRPNVRRRPQVLSPKLATIQLRRADLSMPSVDIVVARCKEPVAHWLPPLLGHFSPSTRLRVFLYEVCGSPRNNRGTPQAWAQPWAFWLDVPIMRVSMENRGFESAVYLRHIIDGLEAHDLANTTLFLQAGWQEHSPRLLG